MTRQISVPPSPVADLPGEVLFSGTAFTDGVSYETAVVRWEGSPRTYLREDAEWIHVREDGPAAYPIILAWAERGHTKAAQAYREIADGQERERVLREQLAVARTGTEDVWRWIGDGNDHPESLSCPVVMSAETLRGFVARAEKAAELPGLTAALDEARWERDVACERGGAGAQALTMIAGLQRGLDEAKKLAADTELRLSGYLLQHYPAEEARDGDSVDAAIRVMDDERGRANTEAKVAAAERRFRKAIDDMGRVPGPASTAEYQAAWDGLLALGVVP